jgi:hypothetical protein
MSAPREVPTLTQRERHMMRQAWDAGRARTDGRTFSEWLASNVMPHPHTGSAEEIIVLSAPPLPTAPALTAGEREALAALQDYLDTYVTYSSHPVALHLDTLTRLFARCVVREGEG